MSEAIETGPPFVGADAPYEVLLANTSWRVFERTSVTDEYRRSLTKLAEAFDTNDELADVFGKEAMNEARDHRERQISAIDRGLLVREVFLAAAT